MFLTDTLTELDPRIFAGVPRSFYIKCSPGSTAERSALHNGLQYDNGVKQVIGYQIEGYKTKAAWIIDNYITGSMSTREKVEVIHNWLIYNCHYDYTYSNYHPIGVLNLGSGVCESHSRAAAVILDMLGIPNVYVASESMNHAWNIVRIGDTWYHMDITWDNVGSGPSPISGYESSNYFLLSDAQMKQDHPWDDWLSADSGKVVGKFSNGLTASYIENGILYHPYGTYQIDKYHCTAVLITPFDRDAEEIRLGSGLYHHEDLYKVTGAADNALSGMQKLKTFIIEGIDVETLGKNLLKDCPALTTADLDDGRFSEIPEGCFENCTALATVKLGLPVKTIQENAFRSCTGLQKIMYAAWFYPGQQLGIDIQSGNEILYTTIWTDDRGDHPGYPANGNEPDPSPSPSPDPEPDPEPQPEPDDSVIAAGGKYTLSSNGKSAVFTGPTNRKAKTLVIKDTVTINGEKYKVTEVAAGACRGMGKLTTLTIGKNVKVIGKEAFFQCKKLKKIRISGTALKKAGKNAFGKGSSKVTVTCPKKKIKAYTKLLTKAGLSKKAKFKDLK